eukprot:403358437
MNIEKSILDDDDQPNHSSNPRNSNQAVSVRKSKNGKNNDGNQNPVQRSNQKGTKDSQEALSHSKFVSFKTDADANQFSVNIENYSEIDWFDFEMRMRKLVHQLMEPTFKQSTEDRAIVNKLQRFLEDHDRRVNDIEIVLFKKDEEERMGLFDSIYKKITENERQRLMEEEKLRDEISYIKNEISGVVFSQSNLNRSLKNQEDQTLGLNKEFQEFNNRIRQWQEDFLEKYSKQYNSLLSEISEIREKNINLDNSLFRKEQEIRRLQNHLGQVQKQLENHDQWLHKIQEQANHIDKNKCDISDVNVDLKKIDQELDKIKLDVDNHGNHFAMVENFVEKYIPIRIQSTISEVLSFILPYKEKNKLSEFEKKRFAELHQIILEDDGIPKLAEQLKQIRMKMEDRPYQSKKKLMAMVRRGDYISINSSSKHGGSNIHDGLSDGNMSMKSYNSKMMKRKGTMSSSSNQYLNVQDQIKESEKESKKKSQRRTKAGAETKKRKEIKIDSDITDLSTKNLVEKSPERTKSQQKERNRGQIDFTDFSLEVKKQRRPTMVDNQNQNGKLGVNLSNKHQTIKEEESSKGMNSEESEKNSDENSEQSFDSGDEEDKEQKKEQVDINKHESSDEEDYDEDEEEDEYYINSKLNQKMHEISIQTQKMKYALEDQIKQFKQQMESQEEKQNSQIREFDSYIQNMHSEVQNLVEYRKKDKQEFMVDFIAGMKKVEEVSQSKDYFNTSLIQLSTIVRFIKILILIQLACLIEKLNIETEFEQEKFNQEIKRFEYLNVILNEQKLYLAKLRPQPTFNSRNKGDLNSSSRMKINVNQTFDHTSPYINNIHNQLMGEILNQSSTNDLSKDDTYRSSDYLQKRVVQTSIQNQQTNLNLLQTPMMPPIHSVNSSETIKSVNPQQLQPPVVISSIKHHNPQNLSQSFIQNDQSSLKPKIDFEQEGGFNFEIQYKNFMLDRKQIFAIYKVLLNKCKEITRSCVVFSQHNLNSDRVFKDCITFINLFAQQQNTSDLMNQQLLQQTMSAYENQNAFEKSQQKLLILGTNGSQNALNNSGGYAINEDIQKIINGQSMNPTATNRARSLTGSHRQKIKINGMNSQMSRNNADQQSNGQVLFGNPLSANVLNINIKNHYNTQAQ